MTLTLSRRPSARHTVRVGIAAALFAALVSLVTIVAVSSPAHAAPRVDVSPTPSTEGETMVTLTGSGFQYLPNAPGGVYVSFGVVADPSTNSWAPSQGGKSGATFGYAATGGTTILVSFAGGSSAEAANALIEADGTWTAQMRIPGSSFPSISGNPHAGEATEGATIDCLQVQCGVITFGAHGMINANNESFTPISFLTPEGEAVSGTAGQTFTEAGPGAPGAAGTPDTADDDATAVEVPGAGSSAAAAPTVAPGTQDSAAPAPVAPAAPDETASTGLSSSALVIGVLAFAVLALLAAVVFALVRRSRAAKAAAAAALTSADADADVEAVATESLERAVPGSAEESTTHTQETQVNAAADAIRHREGAL